ncbi:MAG: aminotransferase class I/II-fold pyridoxal phosphate-dependent enzyme [Oscillospiraceae bacterium]|nr:aminotransferase class I/II-fold pyridoxal phosphate-dependent enzyme [Oscillospiraceae bacterium]
MLLKEMDRRELQIFKEECEKEYAAIKARGLKLDMSRGKPGADCLDVCAGILGELKEPAVSKDGTDCRNYGMLTGIAEAKELFAELLGVSFNEVIVGGNSSLCLMFDSVMRAYVRGVYGGGQPWSQCRKVKFLCPSPGYDRHFAICEYFGIEMLTIPLKSDGPDMELVERLVSEDEEIKGIWCVPLYSNPDGIVYSDDTVKRFANLSPKASDFRIFWDNAYFTHHIGEPHTILNLLDECKKSGKPDMPLMYVSTSKISLPGAGVSALGASENNIKQISSLLGVQTIGYDKINQLRHVRYFKNYAGVKEHMEKLKAVLAPKFKLVLDMLEHELSEYGVLEWNKPDGGYFVSVNTLNGCAARVIQLCNEAGVVMTPAGATFPYGKDPCDRNIRIAPTLPPLEELKPAMELFCICVKLASAEKLI